MPGIPHRSIAITDMRDIFGRLHTFCSAMAETQDQIVAAQVKLPNRVRKQWQVTPEVFYITRQTLNIWSMDILRFDCFGHWAWKVYQRIDVRIRVQFANRLETSLTAPHSSQPITNKCYFHLTALAGLDNSKIGLTAISALIPSKFLNVRFDHHFN